MSIDRGSPDPAEPGRVPVAGGPLQMTEAEKRVAEWEARHDVAARGHRAGGETVQHYVAHERMTHPARPRRAVQPVAPHAEQVAPPVAVPPHSRMRRLLRRLLHRGG
jgi:hypothetical protein